jgi:hypothetical protein
VLAFCLGHLDGITNSRSVGQVKQRLMIRRII